MVGEGPLDFQCPTCAVIPGEPCRMRDMPVTPRQAYAGTVDTHGSRIRKAAAHNRRMAKKRGYTYEFTPKSEKHGRYLLDKIPADLWRRVKAKTKREGVSVRAFLLTKLSEWIERDD